VLLARAALVVEGDDALARARLVTMKPTARQMFADILSLIARLRAPPAPARAATGIKCSKRPLPACALMQLEQPGSAAEWSTGGFDLLRATIAVAHCSSRSKGRYWPRNRRYLANVR